MAFNIDDFEEVDYQDPRAVEEQKHLSEFEEEWGIIGSKTAFRIIRHIKESIDGVTYNNPFNLTDQLWGPCRYHNKQFLLPVDTRRPWGEIAQNNGYAYLSQMFRLRWLDDFYSNIGYVDNGDIEQLTLLYHQSLDGEHTLRAGEINLEPDSIKVKCAIKRTPTPKPDELILGIMLAQEKHRYARMHMKPGFLMHRILPYVRKDDFDSPLDFTHEWGRHMIGMAMMMGATELPDSFSTEMVTDLLKEVAQRAGNTTPEELLDERVYPLNEGHGEVYTEICEKLDGKPSPELLVLFLENPSLVPDVLKDAETRRLFAQLELWVDEGLVIERVSDLYRVINEHKNNPLEAIKTTLRIVNNIYGNRDRRPWWFKENFLIISAFDTDTDEIDFNERGLLIPVNDEGTGLVEEISAIAGHNFMDALKLYKKAGYKLKYQCGLKQSKAIELTNEIVRSYAIENAERGVKIIEHLIYLLETVPADQKQRAAELFVKHLKYYSPKNPLESKLEADATMTFPGVNLIISILKGKNIAKEEFKDFTNLRADDLKELQALLTTDVATRAALPNPFYLGRAREASARNQDLLACFGISSETKALSEPRPESEKPASIAVSPLMGILEFFEQVREECGYLDEDTIFTYFSAFAQKFVDPLKPPKNLLKTIKRLFTISDTIHISRCPENVEKKPKIQRINTLISFVDAHLLGIFTIEDLENLFEMLSANWPGCEEAYEAWRNSEKEYDDYCEANPERDQGDEKYEQLRKRTSDLMYLNSAKQQAHGEKLKLVYESMRNIQYKIVILHYLLRLGLCNTEQIREKSNQMLRKLFDFRSILDEEIPDDMERTDNEDMLIMTFIGFDDFKKLIEFDAFDIEEFNNSEFTDEMLNGLIEVNLLFVEADKLARQIKASNFMNFGYRHKEINELVKKIREAKQMGLRKIPFVDMSKLLGILDAYFTKLLHLYAFSQAEGSETLLQTNRNATDAEKATELSMRLIGFMTTFYNTVDQLLGNGQLALPSNTSDNVEEESDTLSEIKLMIKMALFELREKSKNGLIELRKRSFGYLPVGGKIHVLHQIDKNKFEMLKGMLGLHSTPFRLSEADHSIILPATLTPDELKILIKVLESYEIIKTEYPELQIGIPGRLDNDRAAVLGSAILLATDTGVEYSPDAFSTTHNHQTGTRMIVYDAGARNSDLPFGKEYYGRTDILGRRNLGDIDNYNLIGTVLVHDQYGGPFAEFAGWFVDEYKKILDKYKLTDALNCEWIYDSRKPMTATGQDFYEKVKMCTDAWFAHQDKIVDDIEKGGNGEIPGVIYDVRALMNELRKKIRIKQNELFADIDGNYDAREALNI